MGRRPKIATSVSTQAIHRKTHMQTHSGHRSVNCKQYKYSCTQAETPKKHMQTQSRENKFQLHTVRLQLFLHNKF